MKWIEAKGTSPNVSPTIQESSSPQINLAHIEFPPTNLKDIVPRSMGQWAVQICSTGGEQGDHGATTWLPMTVSTCVKIRTEALN